MALFTRKYIAAALAALVAFACACAPAGAQSATGVTVYQAFTAQGSIKLHTRSRSGSCPSGSEATPRRDAWRCFSGNLVFDPCFNSTRDRGIVVCPQAPWLKSGVKLRLTKPLARAFGNHGVPRQGLQPWALELSGGGRCLFADGATNMLEGHRLNYFCGVPGTEGLWGLPDRSAITWTILRAPFQATKLGESVTISHAWT